jgi:hypothetical protein
VSGTEGEMSVPSSRAPSLRGISVAQVLTCASLAPIRTG